MREFCRSWGLSNDSECMLKAVLGPARTRIMRDWNPRDQNRDLNEMFEKFLASHLQEAIPTFVAHFKMNSDCQRTLEVMDGPRLAKVLTTFAHKNPGKDVNELLHNFATNMRFRAVKADKVTLRDLGRSEVSRQGASSRTVPQGGSSYHNATTDYTATYAFQRKWQLSEESISRLREAPQEIQQVVIDTFIPREDTRNVDNLFQSFLKQRIADGLRPSTKSQDVPARGSHAAPNGSSTKVDEFLSLHRIRAPAAREVLEKLRDEKVKGMAMRDFGPSKSKLEQSGKTVEELFFSFIRSRIVNNCPHEKQAIAACDRYFSFKTESTRGARGAKSGSLYRSEDVLEFSEAFGLDKGCTEFLRTLPAEHQECVMNRFDPPSNPINISGLFTKYCRSYCTKHAVRTTTAPMLARSNNEAHERGGVGSPQEQSEEDPVDVREHFSDTIDAYRLNDGAVWIFNQIPPDLREKVNDHFCFAHELAEGENSAKVSEAFLEVAKEILVQNDYETSLLDYLGSSEALKIKGKFEASVHGAEDMEVKFFDFKRKFGISESAISWLRDAPQNIQLKLLSGFNPKDRNRKDFSLQFVQFARSRFAVRGGREEEKLLASLPSEVMTVEEELGGDMEKDEVVDLSDNSGAETLHSERGDEDRERSPRRRGHEEAWMCPLQKVDAEVRDAFLDQFKIYAADALAMLKESPHPLQNWILVSFSVDDLSDEDPNQQLLNYILETVDRPGWEEINWWVREWGITDKAMIKTFKRECTGQMVRAVLNEFAPRERPRCVNRMFWKYMESRRSVEDTGPKKRPADRHDDYPAKKVRR